MDIWTRIDIIFYSLMVFLLLIFLVPIIYGIVKKKYWLLFAEGIVVLCIVLCCYLFPTKFPYMDNWIIGKTKEEIVALYGEPTGYNWNSMIAYDLGPDNGFFSFTTDHHWYYYIHFDSNGYAYKIEEAGPIGG